MKIKLLIFSIATLVVSADCQAMWRSARMPIRKAAVPSRTITEVARLQEKYRLPNARPGTERIAHMSREQLMIHLKHQELCWRVSKNTQASVDARKQLKEFTKQLAKTSIKPLIAGAVTVNSAHDVGPELFQFACVETKLSLEMAREAWNHYKKTQKDSETAEHALAALVAEEKYKLKVPYDIQ